MLVAAVWWQAVAPPDRYLHAASMLPPPYWASGATPELLANGRWRKKMGGLHRAMRTITRQGESG